MLIDTAVIPVAGLGTRLLTLTKDNPKEMVPIFAKSFDEITVRPLIEHIFLQLFDSGIRNFYFIVGKNKRSIEDHFTPERYYQYFLKKKDKNFHKLLEDFYKKIEKSNIIWINQNLPRGFGAAILTVRKVIGTKPFVVHAGDAYVRGDSKHIKKLIKEYELKKSDIIFYIKNVKNPKSYGVASVLKMNKNIFQVKDVIEKPKKPKSNNAIMPIYIFNSKIFNSLSSTKLGLNDELQLTDAIKNMIKEKQKVYAIKFSKSDDCIDIGTPENYFHAISLSYNDSRK